MTHTPIKPASSLPWRLGENANGSPLIVGADLRAVSALISTYSLEKKQANAAYIVTSCNEFPALVKYLTWVLDDFTVVNERDFQIHVKSLLNRCGVNL